MSEDGKLLLVVVSGIITFVIIITIALMIGIPKWRVWQQGLEGEATLARAEQARKVLVAQAHAEKDAALLRAEATMIVGKAAKEYPEYRQQEFIGAFAYALEHGNVSQIVYVPTEASIPIIEAGRWAR